jgi:hypothetical protein
MVRLLLCALAVGALALSPLRADEKSDKNKTNADNKAVHAKIVKVDSKNQTVTVQMKDKNGKESEKTFKLAEDIRMLDSTGRVAAIDVFKSGHDVLIIEREGKLVEMRKSNEGQGANKDGKKPL